MVAQGSCASFRDLPCPAFYPDRAEVMRRMASVQTSEHPVIKPKSQAESCDALSRPEGRKVQVSPASTRNEMSLLPGPSCWREFADGHQNLERQDVSIGPCSGRQPFQDDPRITLQKLPRLKVGSLSASTSALTLPKVVSGLCLMPS